MTDGHGRPPLYPALSAGRSIPVITLYPPAAAGNGAMGTADPSDNGSSGPSIDGMDSGSGVALGGANVGATADTTQRRLATPMKRVASRVPVKDMTDQPLLTQAKELLEDQRTK